MLVNTFCEGGKKGFLFHILYSTLRVLYDRKMSNKSVIKASESRREKIRRKKNFFFSRSITDYIRPCEKKDVCGVIFEANFF